VKISTSFQIQYLLNFSKIFLNHFELAFRYQTEFITVISYIMATRTNPKELQAALKGEFEAKDRKGEIVFLLG